MPTMAELTKQTDLIFPWTLGKGEWEAFTIALNYIEQTAVW